MLQGTTYNGVMKTRYHGKGLSQMAVGFDLVFVQEAAFYKLIT